MESTVRRLLVSIIIPVYNVKPYLRACVHSIVRQGDFRGAYEILLIDDGSTDGSGRICDDLAGQHACIRVCRQKNAGLGAARNTGIKAAGGEYLLFADADDFIGKHALAGILTGISNTHADVYFLNGYKYFNRRSLQPMNDGRLRNVNFLDKQGSMRLFAGLSRYPGSACDKLIRRGLIQKHAVIFEEGVVGEDLVWVLKCLLYAGTYGYLDVDYYYYRQNHAGSITSRCDPKRFADQIHAVQQGAALARTTAEGKRFQKEIYSMMAYEAETALLFLGMLQKQKMADHEMMDALTKVLWLLRYRNTRRTKWIRRLLRFLGIKKTAGLLEWGYGIKKDADRRIKIR